MAWNADEDFEDLEEKTELEKQVAEVDPDAILVTTPSGAQLPLLNDSEREVYENGAASYKRDFAFTNASDLGELDRILFHEVQIHRWTTWLALEKDYNGKKIDPGRLQKQIGEWSNELRQIKKELGISKVIRDKEKGGSFVERWEHLRRHAMELGVVRNQQMVKAIAILRELFGKIQMSDNSTPDEQFEFRARQEDIIQWIREQKEEFDQIDKTFREGSQKLWITAPGGVPDES
jgi:hypothetical protein